MDRSESSWEKYHEQRDRLGTPSAASEAITTIRLPRSGAAEAKGKHGKSVEFLWVAQSGAISEALVAKWKHLGASCQGSKLQFYFGTFIRGGSSREIAGTRSAVLKQSHDVGCQLRAAYVCSVPVQTTRFHAGAN